MIKPAPLWLFIAIIAGSFALRIEAQQAAPAPPRASTSGSTTNARDPQGADSQPRAPEKRPSPARESAPKTIPTPHDTPAEPPHIGANSKVPNERSAPTNRIGAPETETPQARLSGSTAPRSSPSSARQNSIALRSSRHRGTNAAIVTGTVRNKSTGNSGLNGNQMKRKP
jgi:hypothetical protein